MMKSFGNKFPLKAMAHEGAVSEQGVAHEGAVSTQGVADESAVPAQSVAGEDAVTIEGRRTIVYPEDP